MKKENVYYVFDYYSNTNFVIECIKTEDPDFALKHFSKCHKYESVKVETNLPNIIKPEVGSNFMDLLTNKISIDHFVLFYSTDIPHFAKHIASQYDNNIRVIYDSIWSLYPNSRKSFSRDQSNKQLQPLIQYSYNHKYKKFKHKIIDRGVRVYE